MLPCFIILQKRSAKAGAQAALGRLLSQFDIQSLNPIVVTSASGWLTKQCERFDIPFVIEAFPSSRSLFGRVYHNKSFANLVDAQIKNKGFWKNRSIGKSKRHAG